MRGGATCSQQTKCYTFGVLNTRNIDPPPTPNTCTSKKIQVEMFLKKFKILKPEPTCTLRDFIIMYTKSLTIITPREASRKTTNGHVVKMNVK
jgi:hypothetical protein